MEQYQHMHLFTYEKVSPFPNQPMDPNDMDDPSKLIDGEVLMELIRRRDNQRRGPKKGTNHHSVNGNNSTSTAQSLRSSQEGFANPNSSQIVKKSRSVSPTKTSPTISSKTQPIIVNNNSNNSKNNSPQNNYNTYNYNNYNNMINKSLQTQQMNNNNLNNHSNNNNNNNNSNVNHQNNNNFKTNNNTTNKTLPPLPDNVNLKKSLTLSNDSISVPYVSNEPVQPKYSTSSCQLPSIKQQFISSSNTNFSDLPPIINAYDI
ncbi:hypothetical protein CYY_000679 [Polysphondylium violaceum]|uniref:Uncharacterized protein n=1 Tax=Polysphondylium violaceum TaxID=133409 RepID=A0A8J4QAL8_9MYCE|nr:hypothetical protein CYY_000679 [Polysphondylium violaceum]